MRTDRGDEDYQPDMPPIEAAGHLIGYLMEIGPVASGGMGPIPISHEEILAWQRLTSIELQPWEARFLRRLSREYVTQLHKSAKPGCPAPWQPVDYVPDYSGVARGMRRSIAKLAQL